ncbi:hypothetical protein FIBSPDRAFT_1045592 [Athelia psychrophila]|uniref:Uncharacterized protein n=1 Tax=Athelia psychrophila TaxID=1759441 RepID=A0A166HZX2_9AGAM|nr:hypothetical protein FIBSPDRAFT_1045592 [Fibularhizoctonia sp. CBS 109695]
MPGGAWARIRGLGRVMLCSGARIRKAPLGDLPNFSEEGVITSMMEALAAHLEQISRDTSPRYPTKIEGEFKHVLDLIARHQEALLGIARDYLEKQPHHPSGYAAVENVNDLIRMSCELCEKRNKLLLQYDRYFQSTSDEQFQLKPALDDYQMEFQAVLEKYKAGGWQALDVPAAPPAYSSSTYLPIAPPLYTQGSSFSE